MDDRLAGEAAKLATQAGELAGRLGFAPGTDSVGLLLENCPAWMEIYAALAGAGVTVVPIDPRLRPQEIAFILGDAGVVALFASGRHRDKARARGQSVTRRRLFVGHQHRDRAVVHA